MGLGARVLATIGSTGVPRKGTVVAIMRGTGVDPSPQYMVDFDRLTDGGGTGGPCVYVQPLDSSLLKDTP